MNFHLISGNSDYLCLIQDSVGLNLSLLNFNFIVLPAEFSIDFVPHCNASVHHHPCQLSYITNHCTRHRGTRYPSFVLIFVLSCRSKYR